MSSDDNKKEFDLSCPVPLSNHKKILMAHGSGGSLTHALINDLFLKYFGNPILNPLHDGALLNISESRLAFTTDSYVVNPIFFPGGNIGMLAINGTVNDLAVCGAKPLYISAGFIIEEGMTIAELDIIACSMSEAAKAAGVQIVTGDTKVVERGKGDKLFINTSGIGIIYEDIDISPKNCRNGDVIIINGKIAQHGIAIMSKRNGFEFETEIESDCAPLNGLINSVLNVCRNVRMMRDATRGGIATVLNEIATSSQHGIYIDEESIPIDEQVKGACEIMGFDPLYIANEGKVVIIVPEDDAVNVLAAMHEHPLGHDAAIIGKITEEHPGKLLMKTSIGTLRVVDMLTGEQLPRIC